MRRLARGAPAAARQLGGDTRASSRPARAGATPARAAAPAGSRCTWQIATASASAASCGDGTRVEAEQQLDHLLHLRLLGAAVADDGALDFGRRVFDDRQRRPRRRPASRRRARGRASARCGRSWRGTGSRWRRTRGGSRASSAASSRWIDREARPGSVGAPAVRDRAADHEAVAAAVALDAAVAGATEPGSMPKTLTPARPRSPFPRCRSSTRRSARRRGLRALPSA